NDIYLTANAQVQKGLTPQTFPWAFLTTAAANWHPLTWLSHLLDVSLFGMKPAAHHWVNVALHTLAALLLLAALQSMTGSLWRSAFVTAVFALHPLRVESV